MESKKDINKTNDNIKIDIKEDKKENKLVKKETGVYHDGKQLLYEPDEEFEVKSCCGSICSIEKGYLEFIAKFIISSAVLTFSMFQLVNNNGDTSYFASTISLILGIYINNRNDNKDKKK